MSFGEFSVGTLLVLLVLSPLWTQWTGVPELAQLGLIEWLESYSPYDCHFGERGCYE